MSLKLLRKFFSASSDDLNKEVIKMRPCIFWNKRKNRYYGWYYKPNAVSCDEKVQFSCRTKDKDRAEEYWYKMVFDARHESIRSSTPIHTLKELEEIRVKEKIDDGIGEAQIKEIQGSFRLFRISLGGDKPIQEINEEMAYSFIRNGWGEGRYGKKETGSLSTKRKHLSNLKSAFALAQRLKWIPSNPFDGTKLKRQGKRTDHEFFLESEYDEFKNHLDDSVSHELRLKRMCIIAFETNLRIGEVLHLDRSDLVEIDGELSIWIHPKPGFVPKWKHARHLAISRTVLALLKEMDDQQKTHPNAKERNSPYFFPNTKGKPFAQSTIEHQFLKLRIALFPERPRLTFHSLRHSWGVYALERGLSLEVMKTLMGHQNIRTTEIYAVMRDSIAVKQHNLRRLQSESLDENREQLISTIRRSTPEQLAHFNALIEASRTNSQGIARY
jgi:site-specific recombinase XerD